MLPHLQDASQEFLVLWTWEIITEQPVRLTKLRVVNYISGTYQTTGWHTRLLEASQAYSPLATFRKKTEWTDSDQGVSKK